jgi:HPt (histidine-containing phosphotransfer) domain-containing protein
MMIITYINTDALFERTAGDEELATDLLNLFIEEKQNYFDILTQALTKNDFLAVATEAHKLKSAAGVLGFDNIATELQIVEKKSSEKNADFDYQNKINAIFISLNDHIVELEKLIKNKLWDY